MNDTTPGMRDVFTNVWAFLISLLSGATKYAQAFEATGDIVLNTTTDFRDEEVIKSAAKRATLTAQLADMQKAIANEA
jgi:hypothetical protein